MALSDDQRAMLRLLAQREQGYEDMAALMGISVEELRGRVNEALAELEREGKEAPQLPPEPPREEPPAPKPSQPAAPTPAEAPPPAATPDAPKQSGASPAGQPPQQAKRRGSPLSTTGARIAAAAVAAAVVVVVVVLLVLGGGDGSDSTAGTETSVNSSQTSAGTLVQKALASTETGKGKEVTKAVLAPEDGGDQRGVAIFGRVKNTLALQIIAEGLKPLGNGESYAIWIGQSPNRMLPLAASPVRKNGTIASQFEVPTELLAFLANETFDEIAITRASISKLNKALKSATKAKKTPDYTGTPVMRGEITGPIVGAAKRLEKEKGKNGGN